MPIIICSYCDYIGCGSSISEQYSDAESHEDECTENPDYEPEPEMSPEDMNREV